MRKRIIEGYAKHVGYGEEDLKRFNEGGHRARNVVKLALAGERYSIVAEVLKSRNCNSGHVAGQRIVMDVSGNLITSRCPKKVCVYLLSQFVAPLALINERLCEDLPPNDFHFLRQVRCPDTGVECEGFGEVLASVRVVPRTDLGVNRS